ncbi:MAG: hypothetical protein Q8O33_12935 [Pseudomonadota bacterium]|nr:hypothetical protein [Pseudomonadota bacterium]
MWTLDLCLLAAALALVALELTRVWWMERHAPTPPATTDALDDDDDFLGIGS